MPEMTNVMPDLIGHLKSKSDTLKNEKDNPV